MSTCGDYGGVGCRGVPCGKPAGYGTGKHEGPCTIHRQCKLCDAWIQREEDPKVGDCFMYGEMVAFDHCATDWMPRKDPGIPATMPENVAVGSVETNEYDDLPTLPRRDPQRQEIRGKRKLWDLRRTIRGWRKINAIGLGIEAWKARRKEAAKREKRACSK